MNLFFKNGFIMIHASELHPTFELMFTLLQGALSSFLPMDIFLPNGYLASPRTISFPRILHTGPKDNFSSNNPSCWCALEVLSSWRHHIFPRHHVILETHPIGHFHLLKALATSPLWKLHPLLGLSCLGHIIFLVWFVIQHGFFR